jgi:phosphomannomutase
MALKFGTSGVRGLVTEMTDLECYLYCKAYSQYLGEDRG